MKIDNNSFLAEQIYSKFRTETLLGINNLNEDIEFYFIGQAMNPFYF